MDIDAAGYGYATAAVIYSTSRNLLLRRFDVRLLGTLGWIARDRQVFGRRSDVRKGRIHASALPDEIGQVVDMSERDIVSDQEAFEEFLRALLDVESGHVRQGLIWSKRAAGQFQVVVDFGEPSLFRRCGGHRGLRSL